MPSATALPPPYISVFVNFETSLSLYFGSGMMRRFGTSRRRGIFLSGSGLRALHAVLRALAVAVRFVGGRRPDRPGRIEGPADDVVAHARQVLDAASANQNDRVLLEVVP